jgi:uncharacterized protein YydD (DUF2326 family)
MAPRIFVLPKEHKYLTFRNLIARFMRPYQYSYVDVHKFFPKEDSDYTEDLANAFLLGLDIQKFYKKANLNKTLKSTRKLKKQIEDDELIKEAFGKEAGTHIDISIENKREELEKIEKALSSFKVAENYSELQKKANDASNQLKVVNNEIVSINAGIQSIEVI